jgi:hypothetical protein
MILHIVLWTVFAVIVILAVAEIVWFLTGGGAS